MKLTLATIESITLFENLTGAKVKDCIPENNHLLFLIEAESFGKARKGKARVEYALKKEIRLLRYSPDLTIFIKHLISPVQADVTCTDDEIIIVTQQPNDRGKIYGRSKERLEWLTRLVKRYFPIRAITVQ